MEVLDILSNVIPENQKRILNRFYQVRDKAKLNLFENLDRNGVLPEHLKERLEELRTQQN